MEALLAGIAVTKITYIRHSKEILNLQNQPHSRRSS
jgi:hypothetical protein